jgi:hypothetical protein
VAIPAVPVGRVHLDNVIREVTEAAHQLGQRQKIDDTRCTASLCGLVSPRTIALTTPTVVAGLS